VLVAVILLAGTNLATLAALGVLVLRRRTDHPAPDRVLAAALDAMTPPTSTTSGRRVITVEILNALELAGRRGRLAGLAGSVAPGLVRRIVHDQAIRTLQQQLAAEHVVADVRLHHLRPGAAGGPEVVDVIEPDAGSDAARG
jgi:hypothetical protein